MASGKQRIRATEVARLLRCAADAGRPVKRWTLRPDGSVIFDFADGTSAPVPANPWEDTEETDSADGRNYSRKETDPVRYKISREKPNPWEEPEQIDAA